MHELTLKLLRENKGKSSEEYVEFYIHELNQLIEEYFKDKNVVH